MSRLRIAYAIALIGIMTAFLGSSAPSCNPQDPNNQACEGKTCTLDADCGLGGLCVAKQCYMRHTFCANDRWSVNDRGEMMDCGIYKCDPLVGECRREADSSFDCAGGFVYDGGAACVSIVFCGPDSDYEDCARAQAQFEAERRAYVNANPQPSYQNTCAKGCAADCDCSQAEMCYSGKCVPKDNYCMANGQGQYFSMTRDGAPTYCGAYRCNVVTGACLDDCQSSNECAGQTVCDTQSATCFVPGANNGG